MSWVQGVHIYGITIEEEERKAWGRGYQFPRCILVERGAWCWRSVPFPSNVWWCSWKLLWVWLCLHVRKEHYHGHVELHSLLSFSGETTVPVLDQITLNLETPKTNHFLLSTSYFARNMLARHFLSSLIIHWAKFLKIQVTYCPKKKQLVNIWDLLHT